MASRGHAAAGGKKCGVGVNGNGTSNRRRATPRKVIGVSDRAPFASSLLVYHEQGLGAGMEQEWNRNASVEREEQQS